MGRMDRRKRRSGVSLKEVFIMTKKIDKNELTKEMVQKAMNS